MEIKIEEHACAREGCGVAFWITENFGDRRRADHRSFHCPNGHSQSYKGETDAQKLVREHSEKARIVGEKNAEIARLEEQLRKKCRKPRAKK